MLLFVGSFGLKIKQKTVISADRPLLEQNLSSMFNSCVSQECNSPTQPENRIFCLQKPNMERQFKIVSVFLRVTIDCSVHRWWHIACTAWYREVGTSAACCSKNGAIRREVWTWSKVILVGMGMVWVHAKRTFRCAWCGTRKKFGKVCSS